MPVPQASLRPVRWITLARDDNHSRPTSGAYHNARINKRHPNKMKMGQEMSDLKFTNKMARLVICALASRLWDRREAKLCLQWEARSKRLQSLCISAKETELLALPPYARFCLRI
jgi:hypothetical protein